MPRDASLDAPLNVPRISTGLNRRLDLIGHHTVFGEMLDMNDCRANTRDINISYVIILLMQSYTNNTDSM